MSGQGDQEGFAPQARTADLEAAVLGRRPELDRGEALKELVRRGGPEAPPILARLVADAKAPAALRTTAAIALGDVMDDDARAALARALKAKDPGVVRRAAESLGRIGDERSLAALEKVGSLPAPAARSVDFAKTLLSYRLGLGRHRLAAPRRGTVLRADPKGSVVLPTEALDPAGFEAELASMRAAAPAVPLVAAGAVELRCGASRLRVVLTEDAAGAGGGPGRVGARDAVVAVVFKQSTCPEGWYVSEYVLTHPRRARSAQLFGVRPSGALWHYGEVELSDAEATVRIDALDTPYGPPLRFEATFDPAARTLRVTRALVARGQAGKRRAVAPRPAEGPVGPPRPAPRPAR